MITLEKVKEFLNIDFSDQDALLESYIDRVKDRAHTIIGTELDTPELDGAMLEDVAHMYANRGESTTEVIQRLQRIGDYQNDQCFKTIWQRYSANMTSA